MSTPVVLFILLIIFILGYNIVWIYHKLWNGRDIHQEYKDRQQKLFKLQEERDRLTTELAERRLEASRKKVENTLDTARAEERRKYYQTDMTFLPNTLYDEYQSYLRSSKWRNLRKKAIKRDGHRCTHCGYIGKLDVHHVHYAGIFEMDFSLDQLIAVCKECHADIHKELKEK